MGLEPISTQALMAMADAGDALYCLSMILTPAPAVASALAHMSPAGTAPMIKTSTQLSRGMVNGRGESFEPVYGTGRVIINLIESTKINRFWEYGMVILGPNDNLNYRYRSRSVCGRRTSIWHPKTSPSTRAFLIVGFLGTCVPGYSTALAHP